MVFCSGFIFDNTKEMNKLLNKNDLLIKEDLLLLITDISGMSKSCGSS